MQERRVTDPDGTRWIIGRRWLLERPRYIGFRFGVDREDPHFEPPVRRPREFDGVEVKYKESDFRKVERLPGPTPQPTPPPVRYRTQRTSRSSRSGGWFGGWIGSGGGRSSGSGGGLRSSGGGSRARASGGGGRGRSSGGGKRGGGGGAGAAGGALAALAQFLKWALIVVAVVAAALLVIFVGIPAVLFLAQYALFWIVVGVTMLYRFLTGKPWIVEMEEAEGFRVRAWRVKGWKASKQTIDALADAIKRGESLTPPGAEPVDIVNASKSV